MPHDGALLRDALDLALPWPPSHLPVGLRVLTAHSPCHPGAAPACGSGRLRRPGVSWNQCAYGCGAESYTSSIVPMTNTRLTDIQCDTASELWPQWMRPTNSSSGFRCP